MAYAAIIVPTCFDYVFLFSTSLLVSELPGLRVKPVFSGPRTAPEIQNCNHCYQRNCRLGSPTQVNCHGLPLPAPLSLGFLEPYSQGQPSLSPLCSCVPSLSFLPPAVSGRSQHALQPAVSALSHCRDTVVN